MKICLNKNTYREVFMVTVYLEVEFMNTKKIKSFQAIAKNPREAYSMCLKLLSDYNQNKEEYSVLYILKSHM